jgi:hypothetical protein
MGVYDRQIANAKRQIKAKGQAVIWRKLTPNVGEDPANPGAGTPVDFPVSIAFFPNIQTRLGFTGTMLPNTEVPGGQFYGLMAAVGFVPEQVDTVILPDGTVLGVDDKNGLNLLAPNGDPILWTVRFTK